MTPEQKGRFCAACKKTIVDFSSLSDRELAAFFSRKKRNLCGRFRADQLQREITVPPKTVAWMRPLFPLAVSALTILFEACTSENKVMGEPVVQEKLQIDETFSEPESLSMPAFQELASSDTSHPETKEAGVQVVTKKNKTLHPAFVTSDTMQLPTMDTLTKPRQTADTLQKKTLIQPKKENFIMGKIAIIPSNTKSEKPKKEIE
ncbi:hypothetical protein HRH25_16395 [Flavisolibacter sp. BT320]|nr:hypothetical protein [Flavisolibacter longurius]